MISTKAGEPSEASCGPVSRSTAATCCVIPAVSRMVCLVASTRSRGAHLVEQHHRGRGLRTDSALQQPGHATAGMDAEGEEAGVEAGRGPGEAHVAGQRQVEPGSHRRPVDRGDRGQRAAGHREETLVDATEVVVTAGFPGGGQGAEVAPGAERRGRTGHHQGADRLVALTCRDGSGQVVGKAEGERVGALRVGHGEHSDAVTPLDEQTRVPRTHDGQSCHLCWSPTRLGWFYAGSFSSAWERFPSLSWLMLRSRWYSALSGSAAVSRSAMLRLVR